MEATIFALAVTLLRQVVKNPAKKAKLKSLLMKLRDAIDAAYAAE